MTNNVKKKIKKVLISAGELSADNYAADIARAWKRRDPDIEIIGVGSAASREAGIDVRLDMSRYSTVGIIEPVRYLPQILQSLRRVKRLLDEEKPDLFLPIDNQGFHMMCCRHAKKRGIRTAYFIAPQEWHWGTEKKGRNVAQLVDEILAIFPQEADFYRRCGARVSFVGHPCSDRVRSVRENRKKEKVLGLFPGSRQQEIERLLPLFLDAIPMILKHHDLKPIISVAADHYESLIKDIVSKHAAREWVELHQGHALSLMGRAHASIVSSGTVSLEHALVGVPHVVTYKFNPITYFIAKTFFKKTLDKIPYMSMPNIVLDKAVFPELLQENLTPDYIAYEMNQMLHEKNYARIKKESAILWEKLGAQNIAETIVESLTNTEI